jgi:uncharacterized protein
MSLQERILGKGPKKLLAIDGGGIRGVLSLEVLRKIEEILRDQSGHDGFRLAHYFDYIAGTSTGGIIAAGLSIGMSVQQILRVYVEAGAQMFVKANLLHRLRYKFDDEPLATELKKVFGSDTTLGSAELQTLLLLVMRNASTDSPWPISNNPYAKYNDPVLPDSNLKFRLWQLVRASTAAPTYFPPEVIVLPGKKGEDTQFVFVDGGVTMYNNPAFQMFLMATLDRYWSRAPERRWAAGTENMLIVSVGTGTSPNTHRGLDPEEMNLLFNATTIPSALMLSALTEQDLLCRVFGDCLAGDSLDREVDTLISSAGPLPQDHKLFTYLRYNAELTREGLDALECDKIAPEAVQRLDAMDSIPELQKVGQAVAAKKVSAAHFDRFPVAV